VITLAQTSEFFNSVGGDRKYKAEDWAEYFNSFITNGVFPNPSTGLQVLANNNMTLTIKMGKAWINGYFYYNTADLSITLATADGALNRIDRVVVRWDLQTRAMTTEIKQGTYSANPTPPALQRDADTYELALADVAVGAGVITIGQAQITDLRLNNNLCGLVVGTVGELDTAAFNAQLQGWFAQYQSQSAAEFNGFQAFVEGLKISSNNDFSAFQTWLANFETTASGQFQSWFEILQNTLDENTASNMYNLIGSNTQRIHLLEQMIFTGDISTNPYIILFDNLDGVIATGIWNQGMRCLEC
jgi:hypothetical protein